MVFNHHSAAQCRAMIAIGESGMSFQNIVFRPGQVLHDVIAGAFRSRGTTLNDWCKTNNVPWSSIRSVTLGQSAGPRGQALLNRLIEDAGREVVAVICANSPVTSPCWT